MDIYMSSDNGKTWSEPAHHFLYGCHHCNLLALPDGRILMTYAARIGELDGMTYHGVEAVLTQLTAELSEAMALCGVPRLTDITRDLVR